MENPAQVYPSKKGREVAMFIIGLFLVFFSVPFAYQMFSILYKIHHYPLVYYLKNGLTEGSVMMMAIVSVAVAILGVCLIILSWVRRRKKNAQQAIQNGANANFCPRCNANVTSQDGRCPICGNPLNMR